MWHRRLLWLQVILALGVSQPAAAAFYSSVADFSGTQGHRGWFYGYYGRAADANRIYEPGDFTLFTPAHWRGTYWGYEVWPTEPFTLLTPERGTPSDSHDHWAVRRWISAITGAVTITGRISKYDWSSGGDGANARIFLNGTEVFTQFIAGTDTTGIQYTLPVTLASGDILDFTLDDAGGGDYDNVMFTAVIPEPTGLLLMCCGAALLLRRATTRN